MTTSKVARKRNFGAQALVRIAVPCARPVSLRGRSKTRKSTVCRVLSFWDGAQLEPPKKKEKQKKKPTTL